MPFVKKTLNTSKVLAVSEFPDWIQISWQVNTDFGSGLDPSSFWTRTFSEVKKKKKDVYTEGQISIFIHF